MSSIFGWEMVPVPEEAQGEISEFLKSSEGLKRRADGVCPYDCGDPRERFGDQGERAQEPCFT